MSRNQPQGCLGTSAPYHEINAKAIDLDLDSNPELYRGGWEPRFEPRALWRRLGTPIRTQSSMEEAGNPDLNPELYGGWEPRTPRGEI